MAFVHLDTICARRPPLIYVSPPFCEADFSSTGEPIIMLTPSAGKPRITGLTITGDGNGSFSWDAVPGAVCYNIYMLVEGSDPAEYVLIAECVPDTIFTPPPGSGPTFVITVITGDGESEPSDQITPGVAPSCNPEGGDPSPTGAAAFAITGEVIWPEFVVNSSIWEDIFLDQPYKTQELEIDYPPGHYDVKWVTGFFDGSDPLDPCDPMNPAVRQGQVLLHSLGDDNYNQSSFMYLTHNIYEIDPPGSVHFAQGLTFCGLSFSSIESQHQLWWNIGDPAHKPQAPRHRFQNDRRHDNDGGPILAFFDPGAFSYLDTSPSGFTLKYQLIQVDGLIQQPRKLGIVGWDSIKLFFGVDIANNWDGIFTERDTYESDELEYTASPNGGFGGATCYYTQTHPTAANGCGWVVEIYAAGHLIVWTGLKEIDDQGVGLYLRTVGSPNNPACIRLEDASD